MFVSAGASRVLRSSPIDPKSVWERVCEKLEETLSTWEDEAYLMEFVSALANQHAKE